MTEDRITTPPEMTELEQHGTRRGFPVYGANPSAKQIAPSLRDKRPIRITRGDRMMISNPSDGQIFGEGDLAFVQREVVDKDKFIKVYLDDLRSMFELTKTAQRIFQIVWEQMRSSANQDQVQLAHRLAVANGTDRSDRAFQKGVRELLEKEFIYMSYVDGVYFINMSRFFNGNRIIKVKEYTLENFEAKQLSLLPAPIEDNK